MFRSRPTHPVQPPFSIRSANRRLHFIQEELAELRVGFGGSGGRSLAAAFAVACAGSARGDDRCHGGWSRHQRSASCGIVLAGRHERLQLLGQFQPLLEAQARERLADVELLAVAVDGAVVVRRERGLPACTSPRASPDASGNRTMTATPAPCSVEQAAEFGRLAEDVEDDLQRRDSPAASGTPPPSATDSTLAPKRAIFPSFLSARSVSHTSARLSCSIGMQWSCVRSSRSMPSASERVLGVFADDLRLEVRGPPGRGKRPNFDGDEERVARLLLQEPADEFLATAQAVHIRACRGT